MHMLRHLATCVLNLDESAIEYTKSDRTRYGNDYISTLTEFIKYEKPKVDQALLNRSPVRDRKDKVDFIDEKVFKKSLDRILNYIIRTDAERSTINLPPKWNATDGFNFGTIHNHPAKSAPSPADIYNAVQDLAQMDNRNDVTDVQLTNYISKFASVVVSGDYIYTISIKNARYLSYAKEAFNPEKMKKLYDRHSKLYIDEKKFEGELTVEQRQQAGEYALLLLFGNEIHLTKQRIGGNNRAELIKRSGYNIQQVNPCL